MRKKVMAIIGLTAVIYFCVIFWRKASQNPETQKRTLSLIRDFPAEIFYPIVIGCLLLVTVTFLWILLIQKKVSQRATQGSIQNAKKVASSLWRVNGSVLNNENTAVMQFQHLSFSQSAFTLPVRPGHPDIDQFLHLKDGDTVEFEALSEGMECAVEHELCGFIRIKSVS